MYLLENLPLKQIIYMCVCVCVCVRGSILSCWHILFILYMYIYFLLLDWLTHQDYNPSLSYFLPKTGSRIVGYIQLFYSQFWAKHIHIHMHIHIQNIYIYTYIYICIYI